MLDFFCGTEAVHIFYQFLDAIAGRLDHLVELAGGSGVYHKLFQIDIGRYPVGLSDGCKRRQVWEPGRNRITGISELMTCHVRG